MSATAIDPAQIRKLKDDEDARFVAERPATMSMLERAGRVMPNGVPMAWFSGSYHHPPMFVSEGKGAHFRDVDGRRGECGKV
jgi:glutamate-1-semialdehyde 2,1-aminomutase